MNKYFLIVLSIVGWGLWGFLNKIAMQKMHPFYVQLSSCMVGICLIPAYYYLLKSQNQLSNVSSQGVMWTISASLVATIASSAYFFGIRDGEVGTVSALSCTYPVLSFFLGVMFLNETFTYTKLLGIGLVLFGVYLVGGH